MKEYQPASTSKFGGEYLITVNLSVNYHLPVVIESELIPKW